VEKKKKPNQLEDVAIKPTAKHPSRTFTSGGAGDRPTTGTGSHLEESGPNTARVGGRSYDLKKQKDG